MAKVLGKVTGEIPACRGPDALHQIEVPEEWLSDGVTVEVELPRNLTCAKCEGGGCDTCGRSGAVSTRGRKEPPELVQFKLPFAARDDGSPPSSGARGIVVRLPERGGLSDDDGVPRGVLLLAVRAGTLEEASAQRVRLSLPPTAPQPTAPTPVPTEAPSRGIPTWGWALALVVAVIWALVIFMSR